MTTANGRKKTKIKTNRGFFCAVLDTTIIAPANKVLARHPIAFGQRARVRFVERVAGTSGVWCMCVCVVCGVWSLSLSLSLSRCVCVCVCVCGVE